MFENIISDLSCVSGYLGIAALIVGFALLVASWYFGSPLVLVASICMIAFAVVCIFFVNKMIIYIPCVLEIHYFRKGNSSINQDLS